MKLYQRVKKNDINIETIYNNKGGSRWVEVMAAQLADRVISISDLNDFQEEEREAIISWSKLKLLLQDSRTQSLTL
jgi:hypothetical protein